MTTPMILVIVIMAVGLVATLLVGFGPKDKPYGSKALGHWKRMGVYYGLCAVLLIVIFLYVFT
ncbi:hypothetical protein KDJ56_19125 [Brevibacillus composti]|uniref:Uncharacterized protein n=1 Tax=Brevibacillus composti TaxID=2796470 RepID=A0A7T5EJW4_9BACL|nr:hypothetical protein [Brevibacillus composti]QQE73959.1 hypothetical protein JD108_19190 [Brevibacillus composti]QUO41043.1 hypothetical protein KDJ56_19125 [Brevibacillus composti]